MGKKVWRTGRDLKYEGTVLGVYQDHMSFSNGNTEEWDFIHHNGAAAIVPVLDDSKILMVRQFRSSVDRLTWEIPAGKLDSTSEDGIVCARRELEEETGYRSDDLELLITVRTSVALSDEKIEVYVANNLQRTAQHLDENEFLDVKAFTVEELKDMILSQEIEDSKTISAIMTYIVKYVS